MAEIIGISSGLASLVSLAIKSTSTLFKTVKSLQNREKTIRDLREVLQDLEEVLKILRDSISTAPFLNSGIIERPLDRCCKACNDYNSLIMECSKHSNDNQSSIWDWAKLQYMGQDITGFQTMLSGYKATITIALAYANITLTRTTKNVIDEYRELIENTKCDLSAHLQSIESRLNSLSSERSVTMELETIEVQMMEEEKESTQHGLDICAQFSAYIEQTKSISLQKMTQAPSTSEPGSPPEYNMPWLILAEALNSAEREIVGSRLRLLQYRHDRRFLPRLSQYRKALPRGEESSEKQDIQEEADGIKESLKFFDKVSQEAGENRTNYFEDVKTGDNSTQAVVSTLKDLISARRVTSGSNSVQVLGQLSDDSLQLVLRKHDNSNGE